MYEIDKVKFGEFISELRKEKGMTQKELAGQLYISDKAVSKWETGHSVPDITLLVPLAEILGVSVTELLECKKIQQADMLDVDKTDDIVKKVIGLSEEALDRPRVKKKNVLIYLGCVLISLIEMFGLYQFQKVSDILMFPAFMMAGMAMFFGVYFWFFMREKLPAYYDEHKINVYVDGIVHMNMPGVYFNNHNWPHIVKSFRIWSLAGMMVFPILHTAASALLSDRFPMIDLGIMLFLMLGGLFIPPCILGRKYQYGEGEQPDGQKGAHIKTLLAVLPLVMLVLFFSFGGMGTMRRVSKAVGSEQADKTSWSAEYLYLDGFMQRNLWTAEGESGFRIVVEAKDGTIGFEIKDEDGTVIFREENMETGSYEVEASGKCTIRVNVEDYEGSFYIGE